MDKKIYLLIGAGIVLAACTAHPTSTTTPTPTPTATASVTPSPMPSSSPSPTDSTVSEDEVILEQPQEDMAVSSPLQISGYAPGPWFFEGQIQGEIQDSSGTTLASFPLKAEGDWMTTEHVKFSGTAEFDAPTNDDTIELVIKNDNPSGLPANSKSQSFSFILEK